MKNLFRYLILTGTILVCGLSCSNNTTPEDEPIIEAKCSCFEGILNGVEVIIYGGAGYARDPALLLP